MYLPAFILASSTILISCSKTELVPENPDTVNKKKSDCEVLAFRQNQPTGTGSQYIFKKQNDPATGRLQQLTAVAYQGGAPNSIHNFDVHWGTNSVAFLKSGSSADTVLVVALNAEGKPVSVTEGNTPDQLNCCASYC